MDCSVVIPCHGGVALTRACVDALAEQAPRPAEVVLVDNCSPDDTRSLAGRHGLVRVLRQATNLGFAGGVNAGIRAARAPRILVLNNDTLPAPGMLRELHAVLDSDPRIAAVAPVSNHVKGPARLPIGDVGRDPVQRARIAAELATAPPLQDVDTLAGLCLLLRRSVLDEVGLFDERFGHGNFEDDDFCLRLRLRGHRLVIARRAFLHHEGHATFRAMGLDLKEEIARRFTQFAAKWQNDPAGRATIAAIRGDAATAAAESLDARLRWPRWADADWLLAKASLQRGDRDAASAALRACLRECPFHTDAAVALCCLSIADSATPERDVTTLASSHHLSSDHEARLFAALGELAYRRGDHRTAAAHFAAASERRPTDGELQNWLGLARLAADDLDAASSAFETAIRHGCALAHTNLGITLHRRGRTTAAREAFARAVELLPDHDVARQNLASCVAGAGGR